MFIFGQIVSNATEQYLIDQKKIELRSFVTQIIVEINSHDYMKDVTMRHVAEANFDNISQTQQARIIITDPMALVLYDSFEDIGVVRAYPDIMFALSGDIIERIDDTSHIHIAMPIPDENGNILGSVVMTYHMTDAYDLMATINNLSLTLSLILSGFVAFFVFLNSQWLLNPLKHILSAVKNISNGDLQQRVNLSGKDEFSTLAAAFNDMAQKLWQAESARQEFVSNVSHELKTPLSSMKVLSDSLLLQEDAQPDIYKEFLQDIVSEVDRMSKIIDELLTLVRLDEVELPLNLSSFNINKLTEDIIKRLKPLANQKEIDVEFNEIKKIDIVADEMKLTLAISNLIENAIKYSFDGGKVGITIDADNKSVFITITDNGIGIAEEEQGKVFTRFYRVDKGRADGTGGTGLGLAITHKTILLHSGSIKVTSKLGEGSTFVSRIPIHAKP